MHIKNFPRLLHEAYGCRIPDVGTLFIDDHGEDILYEVMLFDWGVAWQVPMPAKAVTAHILVLDESLSGQEDEHFWGRLERTYKVRATDAVAYALATFDMQSKQVQEHLRGRFGPHLTQARGMGNARWVEIVAMEGM